MVITKALHQNNHTSESLFYKQTQKGEISSTFLNVFSTSPLHIPLEIQPAIIKLEYMHDGSNLV